MSNQIIKIFLASSSELKEDREQFEIFINRKNNQYIDQGIFLKLVIWEDFLDAMSATRLQDEYNNAIRECDIVVSLFKTKVGQYTEEEVMTAYETFKEKNKPLIYTYFKEAQINVSQVNLEHLQSLQNFKDKLSDLGHFYTQYNSIEDLKYKFSEQLIKLIPQLTNIQSNQDVKPQNSGSSSQKDKKKDDELPIKLPDIGIVTNTLELGRLFKPLKREVKSRTVQELNVKETVKKSAELSTQKSPLYFPVLTPKKERWLDVALIIEKSESMILWQFLLKEIKEFLEHLGAFRDIKTYGMNWNESTETLHIISFESLCQFLPPQQLNDPSGRRLVLIISDCISNAWKSQEFSKILQQWSSNGLLTLLNPFPETMWERTNLDYGIKLRLGNQNKGVPTQTWQAIPLASWQVKGLSEQVLINLVKLPIINLESKSIESWVNVIMGKRSSWCSGVRLRSNFMSEEEEEEDESETMTPLQKINNFYATSSKIAWKLIQWLSAIPVSLSTIRLVQRTLLPESTRVNVAEVVMGGLLSPTKPINQTPSLTTAYYQSPHDIQFEFKAGIRESLLEHLERENGVDKKYFCLSVIGSLTEKIASHFGYQTIREFEATLLNRPLQLTGDDDLELIQAFATISVSILRQYGPEYAPYIKKLDKSRARLNLVSTVEGDDLVFNWIDFLESIARRYHLTDIETETLINLFPNPNQSYSIREVAKQLFISPSAISSRLTNIYRKFETLNPNLFQSKKHNKLSTLQLYLYSQLKTAVPLQQSTFQTPTVNRRGEIIKTTTYTASYFTERLTDNVILEMVAIPGGTFTMGSPESEKDSYDDERPQHNVTLSPFFMGKYPITQGQWKAIASRTDLKVNINLKKDPSYFKDTYQKDQETIERWLRPVENVNWYEVVEFCQRLSRLTGRDYQLPSEAQWEYACRAMTEPLDLEKGETYPPFSFGETITGELANYNASRTYAEEPKGENRNKTTPIGQFPANAFELYDMHGNVWEWCADDWHDSYDGAPTHGSAWVDDNESDNLNYENMKYLSKNNDNKSKSVLRGGSWIDLPNICRSAIRNNSLSRDYHNYDIGFRVLCVSGSE